MNDRRIGLALLAVLIVLDVVLIGLAIRPGPAPAAGLPKPLLDAEPTTSTPAFTPVPARLVTFRSGGGAFATTPGACNGPVAQALDLPAGGGAVPAASPGAVVGRLSTNPDGSISAVAGEPNCSGAQQYSQAQPGPWTASGGSEGLYFVFPGATDIATPSGAQPVPCSVVSLASTAARATVLCADGQLKSNSGGNEWAVVGSLPAGVALAPGPESTLYGLQAVDGCDGLRFGTSTDEGRNWTATGCVQNATASGPVGVSALFDSVVVVDGQGSVFRSADRGASFTKGG
ncbi:MAG: hypothetical protein QG671_4534 [Actinomycetota bacterium]|nr:hypothetical protein [Actinomycetota bacterium]